MERPERTLFCKEATIRTTEFEFGKTGVCFEQSNFLGKDRLERPERTLFCKEVTIRTTEFEFGKTEACFREESLVREGSGVFFFDRVAASLSVV